MHDSPDPASLSLPVRGAWIEILYQWGVYITANASLPVRGAWIEICVWRLGARLSFVAPCEGSEDWNHWICGAEHGFHGVAPCEGSEDWNFLKWYDSINKKSRSLWGECGLKLISVWPICVFISRSLWGERGLKLEEATTITDILGRSLWGERGLKFYNDLSLYCLVLSLPVRGARIEVVRWLMLLPVLDRSQRGKCGLEGWSQLGDRRESGVIPREGSVGWNIANNIEGIAWLCFVLCEENTFVSTTSGQSRNYYIFEIAKNTKKLSLFTT